MHSTPIRTITPMGSREARTRFATLLNAEGPTLIGDHGAPRALLVPIRNVRKYDERTIARGLVVAQAEANQAFRELRKPFE
jgi:antitoxin (DNA-binding transcriptional repressor) of toxin-antitoxin stability system